MIEVVYSGEEHEEQDEVRIPKNIHQIGNNSSNKKIYIEDYVMTYLKKSPSGEDNVKYGVLLGDVKRAKGNVYIFVKGMVEVRDVIENSIIFNDDIWSGIYKDIKQFFEQLNIVGWYVSVPYRVSEDMNGIRKIHLDNFAGNDKVCFVKDRAENEEGFYSYEQSGLGKQQGYYIYYEKNEKMKKYVVGSDMQSFYMCLCDKNELFADKSVCDHFTEKVSIPLAYQNGKFCSYDDFLSKEILPLEIREKSKRTFYTVTPIYYQHICYGYCVSDGSLFALKSELSYLWTVNIGMALENIRKWQWINRMNEKINRMWKYDMLTQVLNRSGFFYCAETILQKIKEEKSNAFIIFLDIDGLKSVNDNLGHEIGDAFIAKIAGILKEVVPKDCLIMRYGGDEFVVFGSCKQAGRMQRIAEDIKAAIKTADQKENRSYHLAASLGCSLHKSYEMDNLNSLIELADKKMYEEKKNKRR